MNWPDVNPLRSKRLTGLLGLTLDGSRLEGVVLRRTNGSLESKSSFSVSLTLDPLTHDPELVAREIRNHLDAAGVRERACVVGLPLAWALTAHATIPELPESDIAALLQVEAERGFPCDVASLVVGVSRWRTAAGAQQALLVGMPRNHVGRLEQVLRGARLRPLSFALAIGALQPVPSTPNEAVLALAIGETQMSLQLLCGGGVAALRTLEGAVEIEGGQRRIFADVVARETRITLGQLPAETRQALQRVRVFGPRDLALRLVDEIRIRMESMGLRIEWASTYVPGEVGLSLPAGVAVAPALSLAARHLAGRAPLFEFLPPRVTAWRQLAARYSTGKLQRAGVAAGAVGLLAAALFGYQQWHLTRLGAQWARIGPTVRELEVIQQDIRRYRPWFDDGLNSLSALRQLTEAFPEDGALAAKTFEIRGQTTVRCTGTARESGLLTATLEKLRRAPGVSDLKVPVIDGKAPVKFTFEFRWKQGGLRAN